MTCGSTCDELTVQVLCHRLSGSMSSVSTGFGAGFTQALFSDAESAGLDPSDN